METEAKRMERKEEMLIKKKEEYICVGDLNSQAVESQILSDAMIRD